MGEAEELDEERHGGNAVGVVIAENQDFLVVLKGGENAVNGDVDLAETAWAVEVVEGRVEEAARLIGRGDSSYGKQVREQGMYGQAASESRDYFAGSFSHYPLWLHK
jgi:hypothetical protein